MKKIIYLFIVIFLGILVVACETPSTPDTSAIDAVINKIDQLPEEITLDYEEQINDIQASYDKLSKTDKNQVTNYQKFLVAKAKLEELKQQDAEKAKAQEVITLIDKLPLVDKLTLDDEEQLNQARLAYDALTTEQKGYVTNYQKLIILEARLETIKENITYYEEALKIVELINKLPNESDLTLDDEQLLIDTRNAYAALDDASKEYVSNLDKLESLETKLLELKKIEENKIKALRVVEAINNLPNEENITLDDESLVKSARQAYNRLTEAQKQYVTNLEKLEKLEPIIEKLKQEDSYKKQAQIVIDLINTIKNINELTLDDEEEINSINISYNNLSNEAKAYVTNYQTLVNAVNKIKELLQFKEYKVYFNLNGGSIDGLIEDKEVTNICTFKVNYFSQSFFSYPDSQIFIYKTSLMKAADTFTYAYKVGFSYDGNLKQYVVDQIIEDEVPLNDANKTSEYFILIHVSYTSMLENIKQIKVGQIVQINKELPDSQTESLNADVTIKEEVLKGYYLNYKGINTLAVPVRDGYVFKGWFANSNFTGNEITEVSDEISVYAKWLANKDDITTEKILNCVSDTVTSNTLDNLLAKNEDATFTWSSSNPNLYQIKDGIGQTSKIYQTHKNQKVTVSVEVRYNDGRIETKAKEVTIAPVLFNDLTSTPVATYFYTGAVSSYKTYSNRYKSENTLFSDSTKQALDIVYYAFMVPSADGTVTFQNTAYIEEVNKLKEYDVRVVGVVNGVGSGTCQAFITITKDASLRAKFIKNLMDLVEQYNLDGLDIDWEAISSSLKPIASQMNLLMKELREEMTRRQEEGGTPYFLSAAVPASSYGTATDRFDFKTLNQYLDYFNIMSYDLNNPNKTTHLSPLYNSQKDGGYGFSADYGVNRLTSLGVSKSKIIIGCAGYGKAYKVTGSISSTFPGLGVNGTLTQISGIPGSFTSGTLYGSAIEALIATGKYVSYTEKNSSGQIVGSYLFNQTDKIFVTYDSSEAVYAKYQYADSMKGVGIMCWAYTEDTADTVINAISKAINDK